MFLRHSAPRSPVEHPARQHLLVSEAINVCVSIEFHTKILCHSLERTDAAVIEHVKFTELPGSLLRERFRCLIFSCGNFRSSGKKQDNRCNCSGHLMHERAQFLVSKEENEKCKKKDSISGIDQTDSERIVRNCESRAEFIAVVSRLIETVASVRKYMIHTHLS